MKAGIRGYLNSVLFLSGLLVFCAVEFYGQVVERGVGYYLKWHNHDRPQLGRMWERDREKVAAQKKIETLLSNLNLQESSVENIQSFRELFDRLNPSFPQLVSRKKFLQLYSDFPGQWSEKIISPFELLEIDALQSWQRVLLTRFGPWVTVSFIDSQNYPIREIFISLDSLAEMQSNRVTRNGTLEENGFISDSIFTMQEFVPVLKSLDPQAKQALFPDPNWFLARSYHLTRVGLLEDSDDPQKPIQFGIEYQSDFQTQVLLIPVAQEIANNLLSQMELAGAEPVEKPSSEQAPAPGEAP